MILPFLVNPSRVGLSYKMAMLFPNRKAPGFCPGLGNLHGRVRPARGKVISIIGFQFPPTASGAGSRAAAAAMGEIFINMGLFKGIYDPG
jgi:hypothetical protein